MAACLTALHIWSQRNQSIIQDADIGVYTYHDKADEGLQEHNYLSEKAAFTESRDITWTHKNKRPDKMKDSLKELEELLMQTKCLKCQWLDRENLLIILASGCFVWMKMSNHTGDVDKIRIDKSLAGKLSAENACDVLFTENYMVICYPDKSKLDFVYFMKKNEPGKKAEKLSSLDPRILQVDLVGPLNRKLERKMDKSPNEDYVMVWWPTAGYEAWPWSPMTSDKERANLVLYAVNGPKLELMAYTRTECDPLGIQYSIMHQDQVFSVEHSQSSAGEMQAHISVYECSRNRMNKQWTSRVPVRSNVTCFGRNMTEDRILLGCYDGTLLLYDHYYKSTATASVNFRPHCISWHPSGVVVFVSSTKGDIQVFDMALSPLKIQQVSEQESAVKSIDLAKYFRSQPSVIQTLWNPGLDQDVYVLPECRDSLLIMCDRGPVIMLQLYLGVFTQGHLTSLSLMKQYVKYRQIDEAIRILSALNWNLEGQTCYTAVNIIVNHLLRNTLNPKTEEQLEATLGTFYAPARPLSELSVLEYRDSMSRLARRFFHHLLRYSRFEKAFLLAVDIGARDLFMDIHYLAADKGERALSEVARRKADEIENEALEDSPYEEEDDIRHSDDDASDDIYSSGDEYYQDSLPKVPPRLPVTPNNKPPIARMVQGPPNAQSLGTPPPPAQFANPPLDKRFQGLMRPSSNASQGYVSAAEVLVSEGEAASASRWPAEYKCTLLDDVTDDPILPPPPSHADETATAKPGGQQPKKSSIKVIHFGIV